YWILLGSNPVPVTGYGLKALVEIRISNHD
ncbi:MAG: hypothetical protein QOJ51_4159, partial [Acidobacteriaceae bacterium]|nr:hypothetical protein [Acidobacteriaceae bacterium]